MGGHSGMRFLFQATHPTRGATSGVLSGRYRKCISIHAPRKGCDKSLTVIQSGQLISIHAPRKGCDYVKLHGVDKLVISIHAPRKGCDTVVYVCVYFFCISIHAPRKGCDNALLALAGTLIDFNPRTPQGVRQLQRQQQIFINIFQSTHPARGATCSSCRKSSHFAFQSTHPARGATARSCCYLVKDGHFNPRIPQGVRLLSSVFSLNSKHFNPRTPQGVRWAVIVINILLSVFQSTHPARGATHQLSFAFPFYRIFQSTHPARGATIRSVFDASIIIISIHAPRKGCDGKRSLSALRPVNFNPRTPQGVRLIAVSTKPIDSYFNPRTPQGVRRKSG